MRLDLSAAELFLNYKQDEADIEEVIDHPAYKAMKHHAEIFGNDFTFKDVEKALVGEKTAFYGLDGFEGRYEDITNLLNLLQKDEKRWCDMITRELDRVVPSEDTTDITIYPVIGYDIGIGIDKCVCLNINSDLYLNDPKEILYWAIHEGTHVLYQNVHGFPKVSDLDTIDSYISFFNTLLHTEGYAVYSPLRIRETDGALGNPSHPSLKDYLIIDEKERFTKHVAIYDSFRSKLEDYVDWTTEEFLESAFGNERFAYREGAMIVKRIEEEKGIKGVREGFYMDPNEFVEQYDPMLDRYRESNC